MLVAGTMIGSGIFIVSTYVAQDMGTAGWLLAAWVLTGVMTMIGALSYAELAGMLPHAGGQYIYLREAYSPLWAFLYGWTGFLVIQTGFIAAVATAFAKFLAVLAPSLGEQNILLRIPYQLPGMDHTLSLFGSQAFTLSAAQLVAVSVIVLITLVNCLGIQEGKTVQNIFTVAKTLGLLLLIALGLGLAANSHAITANTADWWQGVTDTKTFQDTSLRLARSSRLDPALNWLVVLMVLGGTLTGPLFSADAWNNVTFTAGEVKNPRRNLPLSLALGTLLVVILYLLANITYLAVLPIHGSASGTTAIERGIDNAQNDRVATSVMEVVSARFGPTFMALAIMISTFGCVNGLVLMGARLYYAMARDRLFFERVGRLSARGVPAAGLILQGIWAILLTFSGTYNQLLDYVIFATLLFYVFSVLGVFVLRYKHPEWERPYRAFGYPVLPAVYIILALLIDVDLLFVKPLFTWPGLIIVLTGIPVYFFWRARAALTPASAPTLPAQ
jgi:APA family basic amino acid/polyamine antiporter